MTPGHGNHKVRSTPRRTGTPAPAPRHDGGSGATPTHRPLAERLHAGVAAWIVLLLSLLVTVIAWYLAASYSEQRARDRFNFHVEDAQFAIQQRMLAYEQILRGGVALFQSSENVNREVWRRYVDELNLEENYPGIQGMGYAKWIRPQELNAVIQQVRAEGFPDFTVHPEGEREEYTAILYLEPFTPRNQRAFGFDMFSEPTRRAAMARARDTGETAVSGKVLLVQETGRDIQNGFLMYLPLYASVVSNVEARRAQLLGFVYSPFRMRDFMQGVLGRGSPAIEFTIYDGEQTTEDSQLYRSDAEGNVRTSAMAISPPRFTKHTVFEMGGHTWTILYRSNPAFDIDTRSSQPLLVAAGGVTIDLLLFYVIITLSRTRQRALALADERMVTLRAREIQFKAITDSAHDGILALDEAGLITYVNPAAQTLFNYPEAQLIGRPFSDLISSQYAARLHDMLREAPSHETAAPWELEGVRRGGEVFPAELSLARWHVDGLHNTTAVMRDITDRKKVERLQNEFVSTVSHELRTPLTAIRGSLGLIGGAFRDGLDVRRRQLIAIANTNVERLSRLINDILDIDRMESGTPHFNFGDYEIRPLLEQAVEASGSMAEPMQVRLAIDTIDAVAVHVDPERFLQLMTNLLSNAIKFSPAGATVRITAKQTDGYIRVEVHDQGPGIPESFRPRVFQKFAQLDASAARNKGGTGLGLSICKAIVERFGGKIDYQSSPATGTIFYFELPVAATPAQSTNDQTG